MNLLVLDGQVDKEHVHDKELQAFGINMFVLAVQVVGLKDEIEVLEVRVVDIVQIMKTKNHVILFKQILLMLKVF
jgi:hypothetical protein